MDSLEGWIEAERVVEVHYKGRRDKRLARLSREVQVEHFPQLDGHKAILRLGQRTAMVLVKSTEVVRTDQLAGLGRTPLFEEEAVRAVEEPVDGLASRHHSWVSRRRLD